MTTTGPPTQPDPSRDAIVGALTLRIETMDAAHQRGLLAIERDLLAIERRLGSVEDALAGWADSYYHHTDHPPAPQ
jgi:hypothetical protein